MLTYTYRKATSGQLFLVFVASAGTVPADLLHFKFKGFAQTYEKATLALWTRESERVRDSQF